MMFSKKEGDKVLEEEVISYEGDRFMCSHVGPPDPMYQYMNGWVLLEVLTKVVLYFRPYCIVEIGAGESTKVLADIAKHYGVKLYSCDKSPIS